MRARGARAGRMRAKRARGPAAPASGQGGCGTTGGRLRNYWRAWSRCREWPDREVAELLEGLDAVRRRTRFALNRGPPPFTRYTPPASPLPPAPPSPGVPPMSLGCTFNKQGGGGFLGGVSNAFPPTPCVVALVPGGGRSRPALDRRPPAPAPSPSRRGPPVRGPSGHSAPRPGPTLGGAVTIRAPRRAPARLGRCASSPPITVPLQALTQLTRLDMVT